MSKFFFSDLFALIFFLITIISMTNQSSIKHQFTTIKHPVSDMIWCGPNNEVIFILTEELSVYISKDKGLSWNNIDLEFTNVKREKGEKLGKVMRFVQSPVDKSLIFCLGTESYSWIVEGCGQKITASLEGRQIHEFIFHPTERNWALASAYSLCEDYINEPCRIVKELYVTKSLGDDWKLLGEYVHQFSWGVLDKEMEKSIPKERILVTYQPGGKGNQKVSSKWDYKLDFAYSDDFFNTKYTGVRKGNNFLLTKKNLYVSQVLDDETQEVQLLHSPSDLKIYDFKKIVTNQHKFLEHSFNFLDTSEDMMFLYVSNFGPDKQYGNVYASGDKGNDFSLSLKNIFQINDYTTDFEKIKSTEGVYLANVISGKYMKLMGQNVGYDSNINSNIGNKGKQTKQTLSYTNYIKTLITHNKGGDWRRIPAPQVDCYGNPYKCGDYCYLHLYGYSGVPPQFYSVDNSPGIIIGNGNVGRYQDMSFKNVSLFISRDGGVSFTEIKKGTYIYEIGDHGGLILAAKHGTPTKEILFTYDEGITWDVAVVSDVQIVIDNIIIEPTSSAQTFIVYGRISDGGETQGVVIGLDFSTLGMPICKSSDYEIWTPSSSRPGVECLLGRKVSYSRRKRDSKCVNGPEFERKIVIDTCPCTEDDYQCDIGYHRDEPGDPCTPISKSIEEKLNKRPEVCNGYYSISKGYRKVAGTHCTGGAQFEPILVSCGYTTSIFYAFKVVIYFGTILVIIGLFYYLFINNWESTSEVLKNIIDNVKGLKNSFAQVPNNYLNIDNNNDEDNTLFDDEDDIKVKDNQEKDEKKENEEKKDEKLDVMDNTNKKDNNNNVNEDKKIEGSINSDEDKGGEEKKLIDM